VVVTESEPTRGVNAAVSADAIPPRLRRHGGSPRQVLVLTLVGTLVLAVFAAPDLASWLDRMDGGPIIKPLQRAAAEWDDAVGRLGLTRPHEILRAATRRLLDLEWGDPS